MDRRKSSDDRHKTRKKSSEDKTKRSKKGKKEEDEDLDEEMEEIFHPASDHFSLADLTGGTDVDATPHFDENDYELHRRESFQYHQPLRKLYHKHKRPSHKKEAEESPLVISSVEEESVPQSSQEGEEPSEDEPLLAPDSQPSSQAPIQQSDRENKVQFYVGSESSLETATVPEAASERIPLKSVLRSSLKEGPASTVGLSPSINLPSSLKIPSEESALPSSFTESALDKPSSLSAADSLDTTKLKVTFMLGEESRDELQSVATVSQRTASDNLVAGENEMKDKEVSEKPHHKHSRRRSVKRKHHGFNIDIKPYNEVLEPEEAETLQTADIDDMASHRFEDPKGIRRHKIQDKSTSSNFSSLKDDFRSSRKVYDHEPHELFVELHELKEYEYTDDVEWRQTARWIKYEEDVELGPDRWGKPHVPPLSFHSVLKLRHCLESGAVLLDIDEQDIIGINNTILKCMIETDQIQPEQKDAVQQALMRRHRHVNEKMQPALRRNSSGYGNLNLLGHDRNRSPLFLRSSKSKPDNGAVHSSDTTDPSTVQETSILMPSANNINNVEITPISKRKSVSYDRSGDPGILRRVPENAEGAAVLVGQLDVLDRPAAVFVRLCEGRQLPYFLEIPINVRFLFVLLGPTDSSMDYHEVGRALGSLMSNKDFHESAYKAENKKDLLHAINRFLDDSTVVPPGKWERQSLLPIDEIRRKSLIQPRKIKEEIAKEELDKPVYDPLRYTGRIFGGFIQDIKHRYPWYLSDILDGFNMQSVASVIFIYFAAVSGAVAFGGLLADKTEMNIGVSETLIGTAICGVIFALLAGQPLIIIGTTGPLLLFDEMLFQLREHYSAEFLVIRVWVGIWTALIATVVVAAEGSVLVKYFSRFVQEIFATIISLIFIAESFSKLYKIFQENPLQAFYCDSTNSTNDNITMFSTSEKKPNVAQPNTALLSAILMIGTFYIALFLRHFRNSKFLGRSARRALGDFGVPIGIVIMVLLDYCITDTYTQKLNVPEGLSPSISRSWLISPLPIAAWEAAIASIGGLLIFILLFMETQICELIICKKNLRKGSGFHIDMILIGFMEMISAFIGGPWQCAATVRSISHVSSLIVWSRTHAPGETPHIVEVKEQRLTNLLVAVLIGISVLMAPVLRKVPLAVLFGVFLYMGISALSGIHLYERFLLIFMHPKHHPDFPFVRKVRTSKMHLYTSIQIICIAILWIVKTYVSPAFPFGLLSMVCVHSQMKRLFTEEEMRALDEEGSEDEVLKDDEDDPDFYEQIVA